MAGWTNRGKYAVLGTYFRADTQYEPTGFTLMLITSATAPGPDDNDASGYTEITAGNGYSAGGYALSRNSTDFDVLTEDDANDRALVQIKDVVWTASGGSIPASGSGARYAVLRDDDTTPNVINYFDLVSDRSVSDGQTLTLQDCEIRINES